MIDGWVCVEYAVIGCADPPIASDSRTWKRRALDTLTIGCTGSDVTWTLTCVGNEWHGTYYNCTAGMSTFMFLLLSLLVTHAGGSRGVRFSPPFVCLSVLPHDISKTDAARITKLDTEMFHDESWKPVSFWGRKVKVTSHKNVDGVGLCTLVSGGCF